MKEIKRLFWLNAAFYLIFWCYLLTTPKLGLSTIVIVCAIRALIIWIVGIAFSLKNSEFEDRTLVLIASILSTLLGLLLICFPWTWETIILVFVVLLWIILAIRWVMLIIDSINMKRAKVKNWHWILIFWIVLTLIGLFIANNSLLTTLIFNSLVWLSLICAWIGMIVWGFQLKRNVKKIKKELKNVDEIEIEIK